MKRFILLCMFVNLAVGCKPSEYTLEDLEQREERHEMCGLERYKKRADKLCGEIREKKASKHCPFKRHKLRRDKSCPGYREERREEHSSRDGYPGCPEGFNEGRTWTTKHKKERRGGGRETRAGGYIEYKVYRRECIRPEIMNACRKPEFGNEYKAYRSKHHRLLGYKTCARKEFGSIFKRCKFYKTPEEAIQFAEFIEGDLPLIRDQMLIHQGNFYAFSNNALSYVNLIKEYDGDPVFKEVVASLKLKFQAIFGRSYESASNQIIKPEHVQPDIELFECEDEGSRICQAALGYRAAKTWFIENLADLQTLIKDLTQHKQNKEVEILEGVYGQVESSFTGASTEQGTTEK